MIKYLIALLLGFFVGVAAIFMLLYFNPLTTNTSLSPLAVSENEVVIFNYSAVAADSILYTNDGESQVAPHPAKVLQLWEAPIRRTTTRSAVFTDARDQTVGIGVKISSDSERTKVLNGEALVDSVWHIYLPGRGSLFVSQSENYWNYLREIVVPAHWSSGDNWRGLWKGNITAGPGALGTALVVGGSGEFAGMQSAAVESLSAKAYSVEHGPVALVGELAVEIPRRTADLTPDP